jgi:hypothetical protein
MDCGVDSVFLLIRDLSNILYLSRDLVTKEPLFTNVEKPGEQLNRGANNIRYK